MKIHPIINKLKHVYRKKYHIFYLFSILALGISLRLNHLSLRPLWLDEASIANSLNTTLTNSWSALISSANNATYFYLLKVWSLFFGTSEVSLRSLSVFFSILSIIAIYRFGVYIKNTRTGLWAAFLLAINYFSIFYAIQARQYSLVILLSILSYYEFYTLLKKVKLKRTILYIVFTVLGIYSHPWFLLLLASQFIVLLFHKKSLKIFVSQFFIALLSLPWIIILWQYRGSGANSWIKLTTMKTMGDTFHFFMYGATGIYILFGLITLLLIVGYFEEIQEKIYFKLKYINYKKIILRLFWLFNYLLLPLLFAWIIGHFIPFYEPGRYEAIVLPAFILLLAILFSHLKNRWIISSLIILLTIFSYTSVITEKNNIKNQKINERTVTSNFLSLAKNNDWIVFTGLSRPTIDYYINQLNSNHKSFIETSFPREMIKHQAYQDINKIIKNNNNLLPTTKILVDNIKSSDSRRVWLVFTNNNPFALSLKNKFDKQFKEKGYLVGTSYIMILYKF